MVAPLSSMIERLDFESDRAGSYTAEAPIQVQDAVVSVRVLGEEGRRIGHFFHTA